MWMLSLVYRLALLYLICRMLYLICRMITRHGRHIQRRLESDVLEDFNVDYTAIFLRGYLITTSKSAHACYGASHTHTQSHTRNHTHNHTHTTTITNIQVQVHKHTHKHKFHRPYIETYKIKKYVHARHIFMRIDILHTSATCIDVYRYITHT